MNQKFTNHHLKVIECWKSKQTGTCFLPLAASLVQAGFPSPAENFVERTLDLNELLIKHKASTFFIRVIGDSMINAGIQSNDILVVDRSLSATHNKIAVVRINDEFTVKRINIIGTTIKLVAENNNYPDIKITPDMDFEIWGVVTAIIHQL